jgi:PAS domain S-box-containing protein
MVVAGREARVTRLVTDRTAELSEQASRLRQVVRDRDIAQRALHDKNKLLSAISETQSQFISNADPDRLFDHVLTIMLDLTQSEYGFIGEVIHDPDGTPYLRTHAITNIAWSAETRAFYDKHAPNGLEFRNLETLFGHVITTERPVISNDPTGDSRAGGLPPGHPSMRAFLGLPLTLGGSLVGVIGIANRESGYDESLIEYVRPLTTTCVNIMGAYRTDVVRREAERTLVATNSQLEMKNAEMRLAAAAFQTHDAIMITDTDGTILRINDAFTRITGFTSDEAIGSNAGIRSSGRHDVAFYRRMWASMIQGGFWEGEIWNRRKNGELYPERMAITAVRNDSGESTHYVCVSEDISEQKQAEEAILRANAQLAQANEELQQFVYTVSHDLKSPLVTIEGFVGLLKQDVADERFDRLVKFTDRVSEGTRRMRANIDDLLELSRIGRVVNPPEMIDTRELVLQLQRQMELQITEAGATVTVMPDMPAVYGDRVRLEQVLQNLISNAIKYGRPEEGDARISVGGAVVGDEIRLFVADNGPGVAEEYRERIFGLFQRLQSDREGTGIGLAIVKRVASIHGGRAWVESTSGQGATFFFAIPVNAAASLATAAA